MPRALILAALLPACGWNNLPDGQTRNIDQLWDASSATATIHGLYVSMPHSGGLTLIKSDGTYSAIALEEGALTHLRVAPDDETVIANIDRYFCDTDDRRVQRQVKTPSECPEDDLRVESSLSVVRDGAISSTLDVDGALTALTFSEDSRFAVTYLDPNTDLASLSGVLDLTSIQVLDLQTGRATPVSVGFSPSEVLFTMTADGQAERAVVLSESEVAVVDLFSEPPSLEVTFPLTLDPDNTLVPTAITIAEVHDDDGQLTEQFALITVEGVSDLYALDLLDFSVNIIELSAQPTDMEVHVETEQSVVVYQGARRVDLVEHEQFHVESFELDEAMGHVTMGADLALLWDDDKYDVYRLHPETGELVEYRLHNPAIGMHLAPTEDFAIARTRAEDGGGDVYDQANGLEILNLANEDARPFLLEGRAIDLAWTVGDATLQALVLQDGVDYLFQYDLYTGAQLEIELEAPPKSIGSMPEGGFFITHDVGAGLVSFLDDDGSITSVAGFATLGLLDTVELSFEEE